MVNSVGDSHSQGNTQSSQSKEQQFQEMLMLSLVQVAINNDPNAPPSSTDPYSQKVQNIQQELKSGAISPAQAVVLLASAAQEATHHQNIDLPPLPLTEMNSSQGRLLAMTYPLALFVDKQVIAGQVPKTMVHTVKMFAYDVEAGRIGGKGGADALNGVIAQVNSYLPAHNQFPSLPQGF